MGWFQVWLKSEKRSGRDRRLKIEHYDGPGRRQSERRLGKRRIWPFGILYKTREPISYIETWLEFNCRGRWTMRLADLDDNLVDKSLKVMFEFETDKTEFMRFFST